MIKLFKTKQKPIRVKGRDDRVVRTFEIGTCFMYKGQEYRVSEIDAERKEIVCEPVSCRRFKIKDFDKIQPVKEV